MKEVSFSYGKNSRGFGIVTLPDVADDAPVVVFFNAGMLHRSEPYRLNVLLARKLAMVGYIVIRVDLSGIGDTPRRDNLTVRESVSLDWTDIKESIYDRFGPRALIISGLCSGADNAIRITAIDDAVKGLILLDPIAYKDDNFERRRLINKYLNPRRWLLAPTALMNRLVKFSKKQPSNDIDAMDGFRDEPTEEEMQKCFKQIVASSGQVLLVFTSHVLSTYNQPGQFCKVMSIDGLPEHCQEIFTPAVTHLYRVQTHRERLIACVTEWSSQHLERFKNLSSR